MTPLTVLASKFQGVATSSSFYLFHHHSLFIYSFITTLFRFFNSHQLSYTITILEFWVLLPKFYLSTINPRSTVHGPHPAVESLQLQEHTIYIHGSWEEGIISKTIIRSYLCRKQEEGF